MTVSQDSSPSLPTTQQRARLDALLAEAETLRHTDLSAMRQRLDDALQLVTDLDDPQREAQVYSLLGAYHWQNGTPDEALAAYDEAQRRYVDLDNQAGLATVRARQAVIYDHLGDYPQALALHLEALQMRESLQDEDGLTTSHFNIGTLYFKTADYQEALAHYKKSLALAEDEHDQRQLGQLYGNIGLAHTHLGQFEEGLSYLHKAVDLAEQTDNKGQLASALANLGTAYLKTEAYEEALQTQTRALDLCQTVGDGDLLPHIHTNLGRAYTQLGRYEAAAEHLDQALTLAQTNGDQRLVMEAHQALSDLHAAQGDFASALAAYKTYHALYDETLSAHKQQQLATLRARYEAEAQAREAEIYRLKYVELTEARTALEKSNRERDQFMKVVAHELQNPLTSMKMNASMLQNYIDQLSPEKIKERIGRIADTAENMTQIVQKILEMRLLKEGQTKLEVIPIAVDFFVPQVVAHYQEQAQAKEITLHYKSPNGKCQVLADKTALQQILENLLSNALKYSHPQTNIHITTTCQADSVQLVVRDEGQGLTSEDLEHIFNEFATLSARPTGGERSTGLGLAIVKMLVEAMGGQVQAESPGKNQGSTFTVTLPRAGD